MFLCVSKSCSAMIKDVMFSKLIISKTVNIFEYLVIILTESLNSTDPVHESKLLK